MPAPIVALAAKQHAPKIIALVVALILIFVGLITTFVVILFGGQQTAAASNPCIPAADPGVGDADDDDLPWTPPQVGDFNDEQLRNAKTIVDTGRQLGIPEYGQVIAVAVAIQESTLTSDACNDDSSATGLFQQLDAWAPESDRLEPATASKMFYTGGRTVPGVDGDGNEPGLLDIEGWKEMTVGEAGQAVQRSGDPLGSWYGRHEDTAREIVAKMGGDESIAVQCGNGEAMTCPESPWPDLEQGLTPDALRVLRCIHEQFPEIESWSGVSPRPDNPESDHPTGRAVDAMIPDYGTDAGRQYGRKVAEWVKANASGLGVKYVIFDAKIWEVSPNENETGWQPYEHPSGATDDTSLHRDHVHVSVYGNAAGQTENSGSWTQPITAPYTITATWGETSPYWQTYHTGVDLACPSGTQIHAIAGGTVVSTEYDSAYGNLTVVQLHDGVQVWYAHQTEQRVAVGDVVGPGEVIGTVGATGNVTGDHLHLEVRVDGADVDPQPYLQERGVTL